MHQILKIGKSVRTVTSGRRCVVEEFLGSGGQGEVYKGTVDGKPIALKHYFPEYLRRDNRLKERLETAINIGAPTNRFLWPLELTASDDATGFGYIMELREPRFKGIVDMMKRWVEPSFWAVATAGFEVADSYFQLHSRGLCYRDISFGNVFLDAGTGEVRICDNDNVDVNGKEGAIAGTARFMAPEVVRGDALPSTQTDLYSLAVLLFSMLMVHHPLEGRKEQEIKCLDQPAMIKIFGKEPVFIFDPTDRSNAPVPGFHDNAIAFWPIYPKFLRALFVKAFTDGIRDPENGRVRESEWRGAMTRLRDSLVYCRSCGMESFYDAHAVKASGGKAGTCWSCGSALVLPPRVRIGKHVVMLNKDTVLYPHHVDEQRMYVFETPVAQVTQHPKDPHTRGLKNLSGEKWFITPAGGSVKEVPPGRSFKLAKGTKVNFGRAEGEIRV